MGRGVDLALPFLSKDARQAESEDSPEELCWYEPGLALWLGTQAALLEVG